MEESKEDLYVALKVTAHYGEKPVIKALAVGSKESMIELKYDIENILDKRSYKVGYYILVRKIG